MWILKQCLDRWCEAGRPQELETLIRAAAAVDNIPGTIPVDAPPLLLDGDMPSLLNEQLRLRGLAEVPDVPGNEPVFARLIFESLASRYAEVLRNLERMTGRTFRRVYILGGGSKNQLLTRLTHQHTGLPVEIGNAESSTVGNFAVQLASAESNGAPLQLAVVVEQSQRICRQAAVQI